MGAATPNNMGQTIARKLAAAGAKVIASGRNEAHLKALADEIGGDFILCDITKKADVEALASESLARHGHIDIAVNASGWGLLKSLHEISAPS